MEKGELVVGLLTWGEYTLVEPGRLLNKLDPMGLPLPHHVGALGNLSFIFFKLNENNYLRNGMPRLAYVLHLLINIAKNVNALN